jgi:predicted TIM-barrel enzyme
MFYEIFKTRKPIIGMIHLAGDSEKEVTDRALEELAIYESEGVDGAIIENYHGTPEDVSRVLEKSSRGFNITRGVNVLSNPCLGFLLARNFGAQFVQFDSVQTAHLNTKGYDKFREIHSDIAVLGGVRFKYTRPTGNSLEEDIADGRKRCDAIVTTGEGTGIETPTQKLRDFKRYLNDFPLIIGAGVNLSNVKEQLQIADGAIVGSYFKLNKDTRAPVDRDLVKHLMDEVRQIRESN